MTATVPIGVILVDNHPVVVDGLRKVLETYDGIEVLGIAHDVDTALPLIAAQKPQVVLVDINMPRINGIDAIGLIKAEYSKCHVVMLSMHDSREYISSSILQGAKGYVLKDVPIDEIVAAIRAVAAGGTYFSNGVRDLLLNARFDRQVVRLTTREHAIALLVAEGRSSREIGDMLCISEKTVETHRKHIKRKLNVSTTAELVRFVLQHPDLLIDIPGSR
jgi:DNA-binding NarL/FixJ family response regulator